MSHRPAVLHARPAAPALRTAAPPALSVVVPLFDEVDALDGCVTGLLTALEGSLEGFELLLVDDGSRDATRDGIERWCDLDRRVRSLALAENRGKGAAVRAGALAAHGNLVLTVDADLSVDLAVLPDALAQIAAGADIVVGDRRHPESELVRRQPRMREALGRGFTALACTLLRERLGDFTCGFKLFRRDAATRIFARARVARWAYDAELVAIASALGLSIGSVPVRWTDDPRTKVRLGPALAGSFRDLALVAIRRRLGRYA